MSFVAVPARMRQLRASVLKLGGRHKCGKARACVQDIGELCFLLDIGQFMGKEDWQCWILCVTCMRCTCLLNLPSHMCICLCPDVFVMCRMMMTHSLWCGKATSWLPSAEQQLQQQLALGVSAGVFGVERVYATL